MSAEGQIVLAAILLNASVIAIGFLVMRMLNNEVSRCGR